MKAYIISYFGSEEQRPKRIDAHRKQIDWMINKGIHPVVLNQEYNEGDFLDGVKYVGDNTRYLPGAARNKLLEIFYDTEDDFVIMADNDSIISNISDFDFLDKFSENVDYFIGKVGLLMPLNPIRLPFNSEYASKKEYYDSNIHLEKYPYFKGSFSIIANMKKHYGKEIYFDDFFWRDGMIPKEDEEFCMNIFMNGIGTYITRNAQLKEFMTTDKNCTWQVFHDDSSRKDSRADDYIFDKYDIEYRMHEVNGKKRRVRKLKNTPYSYSPKTINLEIRDWGIF